MFAELFLAGPIRFAQDTSLVRDDADGPSKIVYGVLFGLFVPLAIFGVVNLCLACNIRKQSKQVFFFYVVSETVIFFRILLFADPVIHWPDSVYVLLLISLPAFLYLFVGLSQVMLTMESIVKYKNFKIREEEAIR